MLSSHTIKKILPYLWLLLLVPYVFNWATFNTPRMPFTPDEQDILTLTLNIQDNSEALLRPSYHFVDDYNTFQGDIVAPPLTSALMALPSAFGIMDSWAWSITQVIIFIASISLLCFSLLKYFQIQTTLLHVISASVASICLGPRLLAITYAFEAEILLAGFGCFSLAFALLASTSHQPKLSYAALSGIFLGLAFLSKLWLVLPIAMAVSLVWLQKAITAKQLKLILCFAALFLVTASSHLTLIFFIDPETLHQWLRVYFSVFGYGEGPASTKFSGVESHPEWSHGFHYYFGAIPRELGLSVLIILSGLYLCRNVIVQHVQRDFLLQCALTPIALGLFIGVIFLSIPSIKEPLYVLSITAPLVALSAFFILYIFSFLETKRLQLYFLLTTLFITSLSAWIASPLSVTLRDTITQVSNI